MRFSIISKMLVIMGIASFLMGAGLYERQQGEHSSHPAPSFPPPPGTLPGHPLPAGSSPTNMSSPYSSQQTAVPPTAYSAPAPMVMQQQQTSPVPAKIPLLNMIQGTLVTLAPSEEYESLLYLEITEIGEEASIKKMQEPAKEFFIDPESINIDKNGTKISPDKLTPGDMLDIWYEITADGNRVPVFITVNSQQ